MHVVDAHMFYLHSADALCHIGNRIVARGDAEEQVALLHVAFVLYDVVCLSA
jgi:hypothetical protein